MLLMVCNLALSAAIPAAERQALIDLYNLTNGDGWANKSGWKTAPLDGDGFAYPGTESTWYGVSTNGGNTTVTKLDLHGNNLAGTIPAGLGNLSNLDYIDLSINLLSGSIPANLGNLSKLRYIVFFSNQLTGSIPAGLGYLSNLQNLFLHSNQLSENIPPSLGNLSNLVSLKLAANQLTGSIPASLANLTKLSPNDTNIGYNALYTSDAGLITFLNSKDIYWAQTQTIAPKNVTALPGSSTSVNVSWTPIIFAGGTGGYRVFVATVSGGPYTFYTQTATKSATSQLVTGLAPGTLYYFVVKTRTDAHTNNQNVVDSEYSAEVSATTLEIPASITVTSPNGAENWLTGSSHDITWTSTGNIANVKIEYSTNSGADWTTVVASVLNTGSFTWPVPNTPSTACLTRVSEASTGTPADVSDSVFSIVPITISGTVKAGETALENVVMSGLPGSVKTNASGQYSGTADYGWSGTVTPTKDGYTFDPSSKSYTGVTSNQTQNYTATLLTYTIDRKSTRLNSSHHG